IAITAASTTVSQDFQVLNGGNLRVGAGSTPNLTFNDDDVFVEGTLEVDGNIRLDGNTYFNGYATTTASTGAFATESTITAGGNIILQNAETIANSTNGTVAITAPSTTVSQDFQVMNGGNLRVGEGGVPSSTFNNDDIYVEGNVELDGNIDIGGSFLIGNVGTPATTLVRLVQPCFAVTQPDDTIWYLWVLNNGHWGTSSTSCMD
ncbi:hypothetical protein KJ840_04005, partial [Patescibacteria group bacterium]|nr:hypothetical protein [Patescibacteria group bacterium]